MNNSRKTALWSSLTLKEIRAFLIIGLCMAVSGLRSQTPLYNTEPALEWKQITWAPNDWYGNPQPNQEDSGDEWWYGHCNYYDSQGVHVGYIAVGYATWPLVPGPVNGWNYEITGTCDG